MAKLSKAKEIYVCVNCGAQFLKWQGRCTECGTWNSLEKQTTHNRKNPNFVRSEPANFKHLKDWLTQDYFQSRITSDLKAWDEILGGGLVPGSVILLGGQPGIGKSTLLLQLAHYYAKKDQLTCYFSAEESPHQVAQRAQRLFNQSDLNIYVGHEISLENITDMIRFHKPKIAIIDSIQTILSSNIEGYPGSLTQIRECTHKLTELAKNENVTIFIVGHVTKDGLIAGPKLLEHMVDVVLSFESASQLPWRIIRASKNRFGPTGKIAVFDMGPRGLSPVEDTSQYFRNQWQTLPVGVTYFCGLDGTHPLMMEIQSLTQKTPFPSGKRSSIGYDIQRLHMLLALIHRHFSVQTYDFDVYVKNIGAWELNDPASDLAILASLLSSFWGRSFKEPTVFMGEVGLAGEVRPVNLWETRLQEAFQKGFKKIVFNFPQSSASLPESIKMDVKIINSIDELKFIL